MILLYFMSVPIQTKSFDMEYKNLIYENAGNPITERMFNLYIDFIGMQLMRTKN